MLFSLFIGIVAFLLGTASAYPTEDPVTQDFYDASIQVLLNRASGTEYYWEMFQGPSGQAVQPCTYPDPFKFASMNGPYHYGRDVIDNPPSAPAMDLKLLKWMDHDDCVWRTHGNGDVGELICSIPDLAHRA
ncbi:hypothetical protein AA0114_g11900 [Alternaria tenuissima]|uniref:Ecp2 effector protein domain-containing protein n=1 Tax=Alternaria tenuissima TaxID=119927 RepID=A0A4Q4M2Q7_9PLEO|nr:hypothetical protein AA0114_g11900 [Alternaria tenuissima]